MPPLTIGLVSCGAAKLATPAPARALYTSSLFRKSLAYAEARCARVYVLSALYHLVELDRVLEPYEHRLDAEARKDWGRAVARQLVRDVGAYLDVTILAGADYAAPIAWALLGDPGGHLTMDRIHQPLAGMQIGQRLNFLKTHAAASPPLETM